MELGKKIIQGDVILRKVKKLPAEATPINSKVLQQSEVTGHHHYFLKDSPVDIYETRKSTTDGTITPDSGKFIWVNNDAIMYHGKPSKEGIPIPGSNDHKPLSVPAGCYEVIITREYNYDKNEIIQIVD
jgi:hypothetical protein